MKTKYIIAAACALVISQASAEQAIPIKITEMARAKVIFSGTVSATLGENIPIAVNTKKKYTKSCIEFRNEVSCEEGEFTFGVLADIKPIKIDGNKYLVKFIYKRTELIKMHEVYKVKDMKIEAPEAEVHLFQNELWIDEDKKQRIGGYEDKNGDFVDVFMEVVN